jgi:glutamate--cysteine ligase
MQTVSAANYNQMFIDRIKDKQEKIQQWLHKYENTKELPLYSSVDIRDAGFKMAVVDTNIFPAGFNNLCEHGLADSVDFIREAIKRRVPSCRDILIIAEEHTRNTWYLENIRILQDIIQRAGFNAKIATFLTVQPAFCEKTNFVELVTALDQKVKVYCLNNLLRAFTAGKENFDLIIMNNDLTTGIPDTLKHSQIPIYPSMQAGWHSRLKSHHFSLTKDLIGEFAQIMDLDPWSFSALYSTGADEINGCCF